MIELTYFIKLVTIPGKQGGSKKMIEFMRKGQRVKITKPLPYHSETRGLIAKVVKGGGNKVYDIILRLPDGRQDLKNQK